MSKTSSRGGAPGSSPSTTANNANNYYGFSSSSPSSSNSNVNDNEINGGGLSFVIHSPSNLQNNNHNQNQILLSQQQPSISSVGSSTSSGISSGSSTITKSSTFNGNTFTRSKPKERKPIPNAWGSGGEQDIEDHEQEQVADVKHRMSKSKDAAGAGPVVPFLLQGKGIIPSVTLSEATPSPKILKQQNRHSSSQSKEKETPGRNGQDLYYFDTSNSNSSGGSVILAGRKSTSFQENGDDGGDHDEHSVFQPGACSTFILTEGEEFPGAGAGGGGSEKGNSAIIKKIGGKNGIRKMKGDIVDNLSSSSSSSQLVDKTSSSSGGDGSEESTGSSGDALVLNGGQISGEEENFECLGDGSESFTFQESSTSGSGEASLQFAR